MKDTFHRLTNWLSYNRIPAVIKIGAALVAVGFLGLFLLQAVGCAVGFGTPGPDGTAPVVYGVDLGTAANTANDFFGGLFDAVGGWLGVSGLGSGGVLLAGLVRAWAKRRSEAEAERAARRAADAAWDESKREAERAQQLIDRAYDEALLRAGGGADRGPVTRHSAPATGTPVG